MNINQISLKIMNIFKTSDKYSDSINMSNRNLVNLAREENLGPKLSQMNLDCLQKNNVFKSDDDKLSNLNMLSNEKWDIKEREINIIDSNFQKNETKQILRQVEEITLRKKSRLFTVQQLLFSYSKRKSTLKSATDKTLKTILFKQKIIRFVDNLRVNAGFLEISKATAHTLSLINDLCYFPKAKWIQNNDSPRSHIEKGITSKFLNHIWKDIMVRAFHKCTKPIYRKGLELWTLYDEYIPIFHPLGRIKLFWDCLMLILIFWNLISLSILTSFDVRPWESYSFTFEWLQNPSTFMKYQVITLILYFLDIIIKFNTGCFVNGSEICAKQKIIKIYLTGGLFFDILGLSPLLFYVFLANEEFRENKYIYYFWLIVFKIQPLLIFIDNLKQGFLLFEGKKEAFYQLVKLLIQVFIICHCLACVWHLSSIRDAQGKTWVTVQNLQNVSWDQRYLKAIYYIVVTMTTTGYGDIIPQNNLEIVLSIICMFLGSVIVGYSINSIGMILDSLEAGSKVSRKKMQVLNSFMRRKNLNYDIQVKIRKYLDYIWGEGSEQEKKSQEILKELPSFLRNEVLIHSQGHLLKKNPIFLKNFSIDTINNIAVIMKQINFSPDEWIFLEGDIDDGSLYIVSSGTVELVAHCEKKNLKLPPLGQKFATNILGEWSFFTGNARECSARAQGICTLFKIEKAEFLEILKREPIDYEKFCLIRDKLTIYKSLREIHVKCLACNNDEHQIMNCPLVSHQPNRDIKIKRLLYSDVQPRNKNYIRKKKKKKGAWTNIKCLKELAVQMREKIEREREVIEEEKSNQDSSPYYSTEGLNKLRIEEKEDKLLQDFENRSPIMGSHFEFDLAEDGSDKYKNKTFMNQLTNQEESEEMMNYLDTDALQRKTSNLNSSASTSNLMIQYPQVSNGNQPGKNFKIKPPELMEPQIVKAEDTPQFKNEVLMSDKFPPGYPPSNIIRGLEQTKISNDDYFKWAANIKKSGSPEVDYLMDLSPIGNTNVVKKDDVMTEKPSNTSKQNTATKNIQHYRIFDPNFDRNYSWEVYFPENNIGIVINSLKIKHKSNKSLNIKSSNNYRISGVASPRRRKIIK